MNSEIENIRLKNTEKIVENEFNGVWDQFAIKIGKSTKYINDIKTGRKPQFTEKLARHIESSLLKPSGFLDIVDDVSSNILTISDRNSVNIPIYTDQINHYDIVINDRPKKYYYLDRTVLENNNISQPEAAIFQMNDDGMHPHILSSQQILVTQAEKDIIDGKIYAYIVKNKVYFRYLFHDILNNAIIARPHNPLYPPITYYFDEIKIIGRAKLILIIQI